MPRYLMGARLNIQADDEAEAVTLARALCAMAERFGLGDCVLDESEPPQLDEDAARMERTR